MPVTNRRPRAVDTSTYFCPHSDGDYRGWLELGNLWANGHPAAVLASVFLYLVSGLLFETYGTLFHGKQAGVELFVRVLTCLTRVWVSMPPRGSSRPTPIQS